MSGGGSKRACLGSDSASKIGCMQDILDKILSNLPVESVLRFKLVSKFWHRLIREPEFAQLQFSCSSKTQKFILYLCDAECEAHEDLSMMDIEGKVWPYATLPRSLYKNCSLQLICSFNGLIFFIKSVEADDLSIHICNPATQEVLDVARGSPSAITPSVGVLFDPDGNKYKILRFFCDASESADFNWKYETYSPDSGDWSGISEVVQCPVANPICPLFPTHVCVGGRMYWLVWSREESGIPRYVLSTDMDGNLTRLDLPGNGEEGFNELPENGEEGFNEPPEDGEVGFNVFTFLIEYEGRLGLVCVDDEETIVVVWLLSNHSTSSWFCQGSAKLPLDGNVDGFNSIVSVGNELLFVIKPASGMFFGFHFLNVAEMTWSRSRSDFQIGKYEPAAFQFSESLFRCGIQEGTTP